VIPVKEMDIKFVCAKEGAYKTIKDALKAAVGDKLKCGAIDCEKIEKELREKMKHDENAAVEVSIKDIEVKEGEEDENGHVLAPSEEGEYIITSKVSEYAFGPENSLSAPQSNVVLGLCNADIRNIFVFEKTATMSTFRLKTKAGQKYLTVKGEGEDVELAELRKGDTAQTFRFINNSDGTLTIINDAKQLVLFINGAVEHVGARISARTATGSNSERFYLRKTCANAVAAGATNSNGIVEVPISGTQYYLRNRETKKYISTEGDVVENIQLVQRDCIVGNDKGVQKWVIERDESGNYEIKSNGLLLTYDIRFNLVVQGSKASAGIVQKFSLRAQADGSQIVANALNIKEGIIVNDGQTPEEANRVVYGPVKNISLHRWELVEKCQ